MSQSLCLVRRVHEDWRFNEALQNNLYIQIEIVNPSVGRTVTVANFHPIKQGNQENSSNKTIIHHNQTW